MLGLDLFFLAGASLRPSARQALQGNLQYNTLETVLAADSAWQRRAEILRSIPGLRPANATSLVAAMPELGRLDRRVAVA